MVLQRVSWKVLGQADVARSWQYCALYELLNAQRPTDHEIPPLEILGYEWNECHRLTKHGKTLRNTTVGLQLANIGDSTIKFCFVCEGVRLLRAVRSSTRALFCAVTIPSVPNVKSRKPLNTIWIQLQNIRPSAYHNRNCRSAWQ